jgi:hypothetical protein
LGVQLDADAETAREMADTGPAVDGPVDAFPTVPGLFTTPDLECQVYLFDGGRGLRPEVSSTARRGPRRPAAAVVQDFGGQGVALGIERIVRYSRADLVEEVLMAEELEDAAGTGRVVRRVGTPGFSAGHVEGMTGLVSEHRVDDPGKVGACLRL